MWKTPFGIALKYVLYFLRAVLWVACVAFLIWFAYIAFMVFLFLGSDSDSGGEACIPYGDCY